MTVHMIRAWSEPPNNDNHFQRMYQACEDWVNQYTEVLTSQRLALTHVHADTGGSEHTRGWWRFDWAEDATTLLADLESALQAEVGWYVIKYHHCDHDGSEDEGCTWDESQTREYGTVPTDIP